MKYSIVDYQSIIASSHSMRIDADFFRPDYLEVQRLFERIGSKRLIDFHIEIKHPKEIARRYVNKGILFLRAQNVRPLSVDLTASPVFISEDDAERLKDNTIVYKDILLTRTGANFGQCAIYLETNQAIASSHTFIIKSGSLNPFLLTVFLNTRYGRTMINRGMYGGSQSEIAPYFLKQIPIPAWRRLQNGVERVYLRSQDLIESSKIKYGQAETLLLSELGLADWRPKQRLAFVTNFSAIHRAGRMDADYFQPKYDDIVDAIKSYHNGWDTLGNLVSIKDKNFKPSDNTQYKYIELANISGNGEITGCTVEQGKELPSRARRQVSEGDVIVSSIEGSLGSIALIEAEYDHALCSTGFYVVNSSKMNSETLLVLLKSMGGQMQLKKGCSGTILTAISKEKFREIVLPVISKEVQDKIQEKVVESAALRKESKRLLECAKHSVEIAIEQDEETAMEWLNKKTGEAKIHV